MKTSALTQTKPLEIIAFIIICAALGFYGLSSPYVVLSVLFAVLLYLFLSSRPLQVLAFLVIFIPYSAISAFNIQLLPLPGAKPLQLLAVFVLFIVLLNYPKAVKMPTFSLFFTATVLLLFSIAIFRALSYLDIYNRFYSGGDFLSPMRYLLSEYVKPIIYFLPSIIIVKFTRNEEEFEFVNRTLIFSAVFLSMVLFVLYLGFAPDKMNIDAVRQHFIRVLDIHTNDMANFFMIIFPLALVRFFITQRVFNLILLGIVLGGIAILYSRTAYLTTAFTLFLFLILTHRASVLPLVAAIFAVLVVAIGPTIYQRATHGFDTGERNEIFAGRTDEIWLPLLEDIRQNPDKALIGAGRFGLITTRAANTDAILHVRHPHNMYIEMVLDSGVIGLLLMLGFILTLLRKIVRYLRQMEDEPLKEYLLAYLLAMISFLIAGLAGRSLFPTVSNSYFWIVISLALVSFRLFDANRDAAGEEA